MPTTTINVYEYRNFTTTVSQTPAITINDSIWNACMDALQKSQQTDRSVARPNHWSNPTYNLGVGAKDKKWKPADKANPHIHTGSADGRAVIGCLLTAAANGKTYDRMDIYIGETS